MKVIWLILTISITLFLGCDKPKSDSPLDNFKAHKAELGEDWKQFKHDVSFNVWVFKDDQPRPAQHLTPNQVRVFWDGTVTDEEKSIIDGGLSDMLSACKQNNNGLPTINNFWTKFEYFLEPKDFKVLFVPSNYTLQEGEAAGCAGIITGQQGIFTAAGTVGGIIGVNNRPGSYGGIYIMIPKQSTEQLSRPACKSLMRNAVRHEAEHIFFTNDPSLFNIYANDGVNGNHPYCRPS